MALTAKFLAELVDLVKRRYGHIEEQILKEYLEVTERIQLKKSGIDWEQKRCEEQYRKDMKEIREKITEVQEECPHYVTTYHPDYDCGTNAHTSCDICGWEKPSI